MKKRYLLPGLFILAVAIAAGSFLISRSLPAFSPASFPPGWLNTGEAMSEDGRIYTITDDEGKMLSKMSRMVNAGDELITGEGRHYVVKKVEGQKATAEYRGMDKEYTAWQQYFNSGVLPAAGEREGRSNKIGIYHTHSEESYVPSEGTESKPGSGGIYKVGSVFAEKLKEAGVEAIHDTSKHDPRDKNSYNRSRRTAVDLLKQNPAAIIDVHRDGIPDPSFYQKNVDGKEVTSIRLVVGRQNPKRDSNKDFAKKVMAGANKKYPGLVKEVFVADGNYNQDLTPASMLLEVGTHTNKREYAEGGVSLFAGVLPGVLGIGKAGTGPGTLSDPNTKTPGGWMALLGVIGAVVIGGLAFLVISSGSMANAKDRLNSYLSKEFLNLLMPRRKKK